MTDYYRVYPNETSKIVFNGGLNNKYSETLIADNEVSDCLNVIEDGFSIRTRGGSKTINTSSVGSYACDGLYTRYANDGTESMIAFFGGSMYALSGTTFNSIPSATSIFTAGIRVCAAEDEGYLFINNGNNIPYKYNTDFTRHGVYPPVSFSSFASINSGILTGEYRYKITYVNSGLVESDVGPANSTLTVASATIRLDLPVAPTSWGVNARYIYRTETSGTVWKRVTMVTNNTATTYDDNKADSALADTAPQDNGVPPKYDAIAFHPGLGRLFMTDTQNRRYVWYSEAANPYTVKSTNFFPVGDFGGDCARGFAVLENSLIVIADRKPYIIYFPDNDPANWQIIPSRSKYGSNSPFSAIEHNNGILCTAIESSIFQGLQFLTGDTVKPDVSFLTYSTVGSDLITDKIEPDMLQINNSLLRNISAISYKNRIYVTVPYGSDSTYNNRIYVLDLSYYDIKKRYTESSTGISSYSWYPWSGLNINQFAVYNGKLYGGCSDATGKVLELNTSEYNDDGVEINSYLETKNFYGFINEAENHKDFRQMFCLADTDDDLFIGISAKADSDRGVFSITPVSVDNEATYWGGIVWGRDPWGAGIEQKDITFELGTLNGKRIKFKFSNLGRLNKYFKLHYMSFSYNIKGRR